MESLPPPLLQIPPSSYAEVRSVPPTAILPQPPKPMVTAPKGLARPFLLSSNLSLQSEAARSLVESHLQMVLERLPEPDIQRIAQVGAVKPNTLPKPKPNDRPFTIKPRPPVGEGSELLKVNSDRQEYDLNTQVFVAEGKVLINYKKSELKADRVQLNVATQEVIADGNVFFRRGNQQVTGTKLVFNYADIKGELLNATGAVDLGTLVSSEVSRSPSELATNSVTVSVAGTGDSAEGQVRRFGFIAERLIIDGDRWVAEKLRVTNDPYSPPELEITADRATLTPISPTQNRLDLESPRIVFDQGFSLPLPLNSITLDRFQRFAPALVGFDRRDRDGVFYQQSFDVITEPNLSFQLSPQLLLQRAFSSQSGFSGFDILGVVATLNSAFDNGQKLSGRASLAGLNFSRLDSLLRFNVTYEVPIWETHTLSTQYAFRDRVFNGSLGFQDVNNILGTTLFSPTYNLGDSQVSFNYQVAAQLIGAVRDDIQPNTVGSLLRLQSAAVLSRTFPLFRGVAAPAEKESGLRFSPKPIVPRLDAFVTLQGLSSFYSNGTNQSAIYGTLGLSAEVGSFAKDFLDYTSLVVSYTQAFAAGKSPFLFDRIADNRAFTAGVVQQIYGPLRLGIQQSWNLDTGNLFDSVYSLEYARRTYSVMVRYNPNQGLGELMLRISDFNWTRPPANVTNIQNGIEQRN